MPLTEIEARKLFDLITGLNVILILLVFVVIGLLLYNKTRPYLENLDKLIEKEYKNLITNEEKNIKEKEMEVIIEKLKEEIEREKKAKIE